MDWLCVELPSDGNNVYPRWPSMIKTRLPPSAAAAASFAFTIAIFSEISPRLQFALAWYLAEKAAAGEKPPGVLPPDFIPPSKRNAVPTKSANPF